MFEKVPASNECKRFAVVIEGAGLARFLRTAWFAGTLAARVLAVGGVLAAHAGSAQASGAAPPRVWLAGDVTQDLPFVSGDDVCSKQGQLEDGFACFRGSGSQYHGTPLVGQNDKINGGFVLGTTRLKLGADFALFDSVTVGARLGYVVRGGGPPQDGSSGFMPFHAEARLGYWLLGPAHRATGFSPYVLFNAGLGEVDGKSKVQVVEDPNAAPPPNQPDNPPTQELDVYKKAGSGFAGIGIGVFLPIAAGHGPTLELGLMRLFPSNGTALALSLGYALGV